MTLIMPYKNFKPASGAMAVDRWVTGLSGAAVVSTMLYCSLWHPLIALVGAILLWECVQAFPRGWLRWASLSYVSLALMCLWDAPWVLLPLAWMNDTGAYIFGKWLGGPRLCPSVSPSKTWSGLLGGLIFGGGGAYVLSLCEGSLSVLAIPQWPFFVWLALSLVGHMGDLVESWAKRRAGIKDTGNYLPGHGGFLDRCDSILGMGLGYALWKFFCA